MSAGLQADGTVRAVVGDPDWLAHRYDPGHDAFHYRHVPRARRSRVPFLTDDCLGPADDPRVLARADAAQAAPAGRIHFLFHSAFCGSTMLAHALDRPGSSAGLSEPVVLNDLVGWRRRGADARRHGRVMADALAQLARPHAPGEAVVVKPSNVVNPLAAGMLTLRPDARAVLLHAPLPVFLASVARKGLPCRLWVRELLDGLLQDGAIDLGFSPHDHFRQTDLQVAAVGWLAQHALFRALAERFGPERIATLDSERLAADPARTVAAVVRHLGLLPVGGDGGARAFAVDSKTGAPFAPDRRARDRESARAAHADEIDKVAGWAAAVADRAGLDPAHPHPLAG